ncbi:MAG: hypothetical protein ABI877_09905 [Gemmatimonadaceae bacterium]
MLMRFRHIATILLGCSACYRYAPIQGVATDAGQSVRVQLTEQGSINLAPMIGPTILTLDGTLTTARDTMISLAVTNAIARNGIETPWRGELVDIPRSAINSVQSRSLDKRRSWVVAAGGIGATLALGATWNLLGGSFGGKNPPQNGGPR